MLKNLLLFLSFLYIVHAAGGQEKNNQLSLNNFLKDFYSVSSLPAYASGTYSAEVSTYDKTGMNDDGFSGTYSFIRRNADSSLVLFDMKGPGVINRIWTPTPSEDSIDFYIDGAKPSFTICYPDLFSGKVYPFVAPLCANQLGGYYCYLPIPFNESCKIVFRGKKTMFHQIGYRLYPKGTQVKKFQLPLSKEEDKALKEVNAVWNNPTLSVKNFYPAGEKILSTPKKINLKQGQSASVFETKQGGRIFGFEITTSVNPEKIGKDIDLKITWDDEKTPAVYCPLADFFGYAFGKPSMKSLLIGNDGEKNFCYFPMPFDKGAKIELIYRKTGNNIAETGIACNLFYSNQKRIIVQEGKFYAYWLRENPVPEGQPHTLLDIKGKGHFVGAALQAQGLQAGMTIFFEGDDSTIVDGELRMHGTGSEDFFNGGWYALIDRWDAAMSLPLSGALEYSTALCRTGGYRLFITDKISFEKSFFQSIEHGPEHNITPADYTSVTYYYCSEANRQPAIPTAANTKLYRPDTLTVYPQLMSFGIHNDLGVQSRWGYPTGGFTYHFAVKENSVLRVSLQDIPVGDYRVFLDYIQSPDAGLFSVWQRQTQLSKWIDGYAPSAQRVEMQEAASLAITPLNKTISFQFKPNKEKDKFILNKIILVRKSPPGQAM